MFGVARVGDGEGDGIGGFGGEGFEDGAGGAFGFFADFGDAKDEDIGIGVEAAGGGFEGEWGFAGAVDGEADIGGGDGVRAFEVVEGEGLEFGDVFDGEIEAEGAGALFV